MATAEEYRTYIKECLTAAEQATTAELRKTFIDMARIWMKAAARLEGGVDPDILGDNPLSVDGAGSER